MFALCRTCADTHQQDPCTRTYSWRCFIGTWVTDELKKSVEMGYRVLNVYEVWHFDQISQYDAETKTGGLFTQYVNTFLKIKQEASDQEDVTGVNFVSEDMVEITWNYKEEFIETSEKTNVVIAAYTTAQARLKLYSYLDRLGSRALSADTDSIVFSTNPGEWVPSLGDYLGDLTDETHGNSIKVFVTGGVRNYAFQLVSPDKNGKTTHCKVRGITLNHKNCLDINCNTLKRMVTEDKDDIVTVTDQFKIVRDRDAARLFTTSQKKDYRLVFDKRVIKDGYMSYPYGY
ncbi:hypothetical protein MAR_035314 [Mya arenaria]|uniref:DNA-directed DNA polymerase n=1 Tax=Mya arenaria TaxID=6604 RepID=A0ABY7ENP5_MYAAR|nr:hypothetical protein MAR_035314 [Mya arenaria]